MALGFHPNAGDIVICDYSAGSGRRDGKGAACRRDLAPPARGPVWVKAALDFPGD